MDNNTNSIKEVYDLINKMELPQSIMANQFIIGVSETGELGSYTISHKIKRKQ